MSYFPVLKSFIDLVSKFRMHIENSFSDTLEAQIISKCIGMFKIAKLASYSLAFMILKIKIRQKIVIDKIIRQKFSHLPEVSQKKKLQHNKNKKQHSNK